MLCPFLWAGLSFSCLRSCLPACLPSGLGCCVRLLGLVFLLSPVLPRSLSPIWSGMLCLPSWCVSQPSLSLVLSPILSSSWSGMPCPCFGLVSKISCAICATVWGLFCFCFLFFQSFLALCSESPEVEVTEEVLLMRKESTSL